MIRWASKYFGSVPPVFIDGLLYALIAMLTFSQAYFGGDEAAKYISPAVKFWLNGIIGMSAAICAATKMFRSTSFKDHQDAKKEENTKTFYRDDKGTP